MSTASTPPEPSSPTQQSGVSLGEALGVWSRVALLSFGGPAGQIALMHRIIVDEKRWIGENRFLNALNYCMLLPGPEAQQLAIYIGWLMHRTAGGLVAGLLFILPGFLAILALSLVYVAFGTLDIVAGVFFGLKAAVLAIVASAVMRIGSRALRTPFRVLIALLAFFALFVFGLPFPAVIAVAALAGLIEGQVSRAGAGWPAHGGGPENGLSDRDSVIGEALPAHARPDLAWSLRLGALLLLLWLAPVAILWLGLGPDHVFTRIAVFFSQMAVVTFGGAYAVLAYVAQEAVGTFGWLTPGEMLDGLGMAETTPGPLIQVVQFVGFMGAYRNAGALDPMLAGVLAAVLVTWVTFVPCFLWIFLGAPFIERLRHNRALASALSGITAAVVGVIANLAVWFALHTLFRQVASTQVIGLTLELPILSTLDPLALALSVAAVLAVFWLRAGTLTVLLASALAGAALTLLGW